jgi:hypothetical protein
VFRKRALNFPIPFLVSGERGAKPGCCIMHTVESFALEFLLLCNGNAHFRVVVEGEVVVVAHVSHHRRADTKKITDAK